MKPIRILVVDDSVVIRKLLSDTLSKEAGFEVVGTAGDGRIALAKISQLHPDLITLDIEMPVMSGLETLAEIRKTDHKIPVIMFSTLTERGAAATLDALSLGASDYATKPSNTGSPAVAIEQIRVELIPKIKALCAAQLGRDASPVVALPKTVNRAACAIGAAITQARKANRDCGDRNVHGRTERAGAGDSLRTEGFSCADCGGAAYAADFHAISGGTAGEPLGDSRGRRAGGRRAGTGESLDRSGKLSHDGVENGE